jgi:hypothetical protein
VAHKDGYSIVRAKLKKLSELCKEYNMPDLTEKKIVLEDRVLFEHFAHEHEYAYQAYRRAPNIESMLYRSDFKQKDDGGAEQRVRDIIEECEKARSKKKGFGWQRRRRTEGSS